MTGLFAPNRVAVLTALLGAIAAAVVTLLGAVDSIEKAVVVVAVVVAFAAVIIVYLLGSQKDEARKFNALKPYEQNAVALKQASPAAHVAIAVDVPAKVSLDAAAVHEALRREISRVAPDATTPPLDLGDPDDLSDEDPHAALPTRAEHSALNDGDEPTGGAS